MALLLDSLQVGCRDNDKGEIENSGSSYVTQESCLVANPSIQGNAMSLNSQKSSEAVNFSTTTECLRVTGVANSIPPRSRQILSINEMAWVYTVMKWKVPECHSGQSLPTRFLRCGNVRRMSDRFSRDVGNTYFLKNIKISFYMLAANPNTNNTAGQTRHRCELWVGPGAGI